MNLPVCKNDSSTLKSELSLLFNKTIDKLLTQSRHKSKILIGCNQFSKDEVSRNIIKLIMDNSLIPDPSSAKDSQWITVQSRSRIRNHRSRNSEVRRGDDFQIPTCNRFLGN